jgi:hypothetical protein
LWGWTIRIERLSAVLILLSCRAPEPRCWLGMTMTLEREPPGIRVRHVLTGGPAHEAGLRHNDLIVGADRISFDLPPEELLQRFNDSIAAGRPGEIVALRVLRGVERRATLDGVPLPDIPDDPDEFLRGRPVGSTLRIESFRPSEPVTLPVVLRPRPRALEGRPHRAPDPPSYPTPEIESLARDAAAKFGFDRDLADLLERLRRRTESPDPFRPAEITQAQLHPFFLPELSRELAGRYRSDDVPALLHSAAIPNLRTGLTVEGHADQIERVFERAKTCLDRAFAALVSEDRRFLRGAIDGLAGAMIEATYLQSDSNAARLLSNLRLIRLAAEVDYDALSEGAAELAALARPDFLRGLRRDLEGDSLPWSKETPFGKFVFAGRGRDWHRADAALIVDAGGDDLYTNNAGASRESIPIAVVIDLQGIDAYESSVDVAQGSGRMGYGLLVDVEGDDSYLGGRWCQGSGALGVGILIDESGRDVRRADAFAQGAAAFGVGLLIDGGGDDRYEASRYAQGLGAGRAVGLLRDDGGDDRYYCKGRHPTSFGDAGIFEGWGQGCGTGLRGLASGGIGILLDPSGDDRYEGGNYTQGGGFYFGWGILIDEGGADRYVASRWAQGFAAHQALGYLEDGSGDDRYVIRQGGGQSFAWDESVAGLLDRSGNDEYVGGRFHCQAASAHNGLSLFQDLRGDDRYDYAPGPANAGPNDYYGGTSLSLFLDSGGRDRYPEELNGRDRHSPGHGLFVDRE